MFRVFLVCCLTALAAASGDMDSSDPFGGASWEFEKFSCKIQWPDPSQYAEEDELQRGKRLSGMSVEYAGPSEHAIAEHINSFKPAFEMINKRLKELFVSTGSGYVEGRLKSVSSLKKNIEKYNKSLSEFQDIIGFRVTTRTKTHVLKAKSTLLNDVLNFTILKLKCYGVCPGSGKYRSEDGYRRVHMIVEVDEKPAEIQLSTPYMTLFADYTHDIVYKGPDVISKDLDVKNYTLELAEYYYSLDEERDQLPSCPNVLSVANVKDILEKGLEPAEVEKVYKKLGQPPNACQWWNDLIVNHMTEDTCPADKENSTGQRQKGSVLASLLVALVAVIMMH